MVDLTLALAVLLCGSTLAHVQASHVQAVVEHSLDSGRSFQRIGVIHLQDELRGTIPIITGSYERQPVTEHQVTQLQQLVEEDRLYLWRVQLEGKPAVQTSIKAACLAEHFQQQVPALTLSEAGSIISAQLTVPTAPDGSCSASRALQTLRLLPQEQLLEPDSLSVAVRTPAVGPSVPKWPPAADAPDTLAAAGGAKPAGQQQQASQQRRPAAAGQQQQGSQEQQEGAEGEQPAPPPDTRTWLQKNWLMVMAGGMMVVNMVLKAAVGDMQPAGQQQGRPGPVAVRPGGAPVRR